MLRVQRLLFNARTFLPNNPQEALKHLHFFPLMSSHCFRRLKARCLKLITFPTALELPKSLEVLFFSMLSHHGASLPKSTTHQHRPWLVGSSGCGQPNAVKVVKLFQQVILCLLGDPCYKPFASALYVTSKLQACTNLLEHPSTCFHPQVYSIGT